MCRVALAAGDTTIAPRSRFLLVVGLAVALVASLWIAVSPVRHTPIVSGPPLPMATVSGDVPLLGVNYTHVAFPDCGLDEGGIIAGGRLADTDVVRQHLRAMRRDGVQTLRLLVWHMSNPGEHRWGVVGSRGGRLSGVASDNLAQYAALARHLGFARLTVALSPQWTNNPLEGNYDLGLEDENWRFIRSVRDIVVAHGPADTRIDLLNEGAPSAYLDPRVHRTVTGYLQRMYRRYVDEFGHRDVTVSAIAAAGPEDRGDRVRHLVDALRRTGHPLPLWFDVHLNVDPASARYGLEHTADILDATDATGSIVIGEAPYGDAAVAVALAASSDWRRVEEVTQWVSQPGDRCNAAPPYDVDAYARVATGAVSSTAVPVGCRGVLMGGCRQLEDGARSTSLETSPAGRELRRELAVVIQPPF